MNRDARDSSEALPTTSRELTGRSLRLWRIVLSLSEVPASPARKAGGPASAVAGLSENLVLEFDEAYTAFVDGFVSLPSESQMLALQAIDTHLAGMVAAKDAALWTDAARRETVVWEEVRALATSVLVAFDWPAKPD